MLSKRLQAIVKLIKPNAQTLADIGTDHAKLPIEVVQQKLVGRAYAVDLRPQPLKRAKKNISKTKTENQVFPILADGLNFLTQVKETETIDYCVLAGLGSKTILEILKNDSPRIKNYLICSNSQTKDLRKWANQNQFTISQEDFLVEKSREYWILAIDKSADFKVCENEAFGDFKWYETNLSYRDYLNNLIRYYEKLVVGISDLVVKEEFELETKKIKEYLRLWN